ncbi:MAG: sulfatase-like hydrolase/transferase [Candidatus Eremiobacteraeota bacterium]|nr:sulfatase-like hydrolase/transferase [Candidatus Eremiobacteraeota bacterium]
MKNFRKLMQLKTGISGFLNLVLLITFLLLMAYTLTISEVFAVDNQDAIKAKLPLTPSKTSRQIKNKHYNILFILTDQERYFNEYPKGLKLPAREWMMNNGVTFTNHQICASMCTPSRAAILTGLHTPDNGMFDNANYPYIKSLSPDLTTTGDMLRQSGYYTAYKGKVHLSNEMEPGDTEKYFNNAMEPYGFSDYNYLGDDYGHEWGGYHNDASFTGDSIKWLRAKGNDLRDKKKPWFLSVNLVNPHDIMYFNADSSNENVQDNGHLPAPALRAPDNSMYEKIWNYPLPKSALQPIKEKGRPLAHYEYVETFDLMLGKVQNDREHWERYQDYYLNCIKNADMDMERLLNELKAQGLIENTIIVFTSDHGEMAGAHGMKGKGPFAYREHINVPLIIVHPDGPKGKVCNALTSHVDLAPTLVALSGVSDDKKAEITKGLPGHDLTPLLSDPEKAGIRDIRDSMLFTYCGISTLDHNFFKKTMEIIEKEGSDNLKEKLQKAGVKLDLNKRGFVRTVFDGRYKYSRYFAPTQHNAPRTMEQILKYNDIELFDLEKDPDEMVNLGVDPEKNKDLILKMNEKLNKIIEKEIGKDDGSYLPKLPGIEWDVTKFDP